MTLTALTAFIEAAQTSISKFQFRKAFEQIRGVLSEPELKDFEPQVDALEQRYFFMMRYLSSSNPFPSAEEEMSDLTTELNSLLNKIERKIRTVLDNGAFYAQVRYQERRPGETLESLFADYLDEQKSLATDPTALTDTRRRERIERIASEIFMRLWTIPEVSEDQANTIYAMLTDEDIPSYDREMWLIGLALSMTPDKFRASVLTETYLHTKGRLSLTALVWVCLCYLRNQKEPNYYDLAIELIKNHDYSAVLDFVTEYLRILVNKPQNDLNSMLNELKKMSASINDNMIGMHLGPTADPMNIADSMMGKLPTGSFDKIKAFNEAQMKGDDVFASSIGMMRSYSFFRLLSTWFLPFHIDRSELAPIVDTEGAGMAAILEKMPMLCDSDKYALVLSLTSVPESMRSSMLANNYSAISNITSSEEGSEILENLKETTSNRYLINNALKNIARVVRSFPGASELCIPTAVEHIEKLVASPENVDISIDYKKFISDIADLGFAELAHTLYSSFIEDNDLALLVRVGDSALKAKSRELAARYFLHAIELGDDSIGTAMKLASVMLMHPVWQGMMSTNKQYTPADILAPFAESGADNIEYLKLRAKAYAAIGEHILEAETYYNIDYLLPKEDTSTKLPLARALLKCGEAQNAYDMLSPVLEKEPTVGTLITASIALWLLGSRDKAINNLVEALKLYNNDISKLTHKLSNQIELTLSAFDFDDNHQSLRLLPDLFAYTVQGSRFGYIN